MEKTRKITAILVLAVVLFLNLTSSATAQSKTSKADCASVFRKGPYLIFEGDNTKMRVLWQLVEDIPATIKWGLDTSYALGSGKTAEYGKDHQHAFIITGLKPGTKYFYQKGVSTSLPLLSRISPLFFPRDKLLIYYRGNHNRLL